MKIVVLNIVLSLSIIATACDGAPSQNSQVNTTSSSSTVGVAISNNNAGLVASGHSSQPVRSNQITESNLPAQSSGNNSALMMGGNATAIDTTEFDVKIARAEKESKQKSKDQAAKKALGEAYAERAFALTEAAQYRSALGDFRRALKLDPSNNEAQQMHDQIVKIFKDLNREPPKEGEEPPPLPFKKA